MIDEVVTDPSVLAEMEMIFAEAARKAEKRRAREAAAPPKQKGPLNFPKGISCVYVIGDPDQRVVKIGWSTNLRSRLANLQCGSALPLRLLWAARGGRALEDALHAWFNDQRLEGEWFDFPDSDAVFQVKAAVEVLRGVDPLPVGVEDIRKEPVQH
jgi:Meiotically up-regulated gene 113